MKKKPHSHSNIELKSSNSQFVWSGWEGNIWDDGEGEQSENDNDDDNISGEYLCLYKYLSWASFIGFYMVVILASIAAVVIVIIFFFFIIGVFRSDRLRSLFQ